MTFPREPVSFIVPAYNCADTIRQSVGSIIEGNFEAGDELILVDDASTDETPLILDQMQNSHPYTKVITHRENKGTAAAARNTGIEIAANELIFCLDSDNILQSGSVRPLAAHLLKTGADAAAFRELHYFREDPQKVTHKWIYKDVITLADALAGVVWPGPSGNYLFTRESWKRAGRYHEPYLENRSLDSWAFGIRQLGTGSKMVTLPGTWYFHRYGHNSHYVQNWQRGSQSLAALIGLIPFLDVIVEEDVDYILSPEGRTSWYEQLGQHPLRIKSGPRGKDGMIEYLPLYKREQQKLHAVSLIRKVRSRLRSSGA